MTGDERDRHILEPDLQDLQVLDPADDARPDAGRDPGAQALLDRIIEEPQSGIAPEVKQVGH